jgi:quinol-cytochrome oxidoreductase complex cytochrome b subunit
MAKRNLHLPLRFSARILWGGNTSSKNENFLLNRFLGIHIFQEGALILLILVP